MADSATGVTTGTPEASPAKRSSPVPRPWFFVHWLSLAAAVPFLFWINRDQWFSGDEWAVITTGGMGGNPQKVSLFAPHFEHWITLVVLVYRALYSVFALHSYVPYTLVLIAVQVLVAHALWRLLLRVGVNAGFATGVAAIFVVLAIGWENLSTAFQITIIAPVALGFAVLLLMPERGPFRRRDALGWILLVAALMCSGTGVTMTIVVGIAALLRRGWRTAAAVVSVPALCYAAWFATEGTKGQRNTASVSTALSDLPGFVWRGTTEALGGLTRFGFTGPIILVVLAVWLVWRARGHWRTEPWPLLLATSIGAVVSIALTGIRRAGTDAGASRYAYVVVVLLLPALAVATQELARVIVRRFGRPATIVGAALVVALLVAQAVALNHYVETEAFVGEMRPRVLGVAALLRADEPVISTNIFGIPYLTQPSTSTIARFDRNGELPTLADLTRSDLLTAREYVQLVTGTTGLFGEGIVTVAGATNARISPSSTGCVIVTAAAGHPSVTLAIPQAASFRLTTAVDWNITAQLEAGGAKGRPRLLAAPGGQEIAVSVARGDLGLRLGLPPNGATTICGLAAGSGEPS